MTSDELRVWNANYDGAALIARVRSLLDRDIGLLGDVVQRSVLVKSQQLNPTEFQHAITRIDVLAKSVSPSQSKCVDYGNVLFVTETITTDMLLTRLTALKEKQFTVGIHTLISSGVGFSDRYEASHNWYCDWPCRVFDVSFGSVQLSYESLLHPVQKAYSSVFEAIQEFVEFERFNGSSDSRLGHIQICVPNFNARIEKLDLADSQLRIVVAGATPPGSLKLALNYGIDDKSVNIDQEFVGREVTIDLSFTPQKLTSFLISRDGFLADFHEENQHYSTGASPVLPKTKEQQALWAPYWSPLDTTFLSTDHSLGATQSASEPLRLDPLLNIPDKGTFERFFEQVRNQASAEFPLSLLFVDIDHFKSVNDTYGHETGDEILKQVASVLVGVCGQKGTVYRIGGEEIGIVLLNYGSAEAEALAERIRKRVAALREPRNPPLVTVSIGVATLPENVSSGDELYGAADRAMYAAKASGRNQVRTATMTTPGPKAIVLTRQALSVFMRTNERVRRLDEEIAKSSGQPFTQAEDASLHVFEKTQHLGVASIDELAQLVQKYGDTAQNLARCMVPTTPIPAGQSLTYVLDVIATQKGEQALRAYFQSLRYTTTAEEYIRELMETLALLP
jgi:diguanylate cyclase (GGDEF)-like protein